MDCNPPGSSVHGILQARVLEWAAFPSLSRGSSQPRSPALHSTPVLLPGESHAQRSLAGHSPRGLSQTQLSDEHYPLLLLLHRRQILYGRSHLGNQKAISVAKYFLVWPSSGKGCIHLFFLLSFTSGQDQSVSQRAEQRQVSFTFMQKGRVPQGKSLCIDSIFLTDKSHGKQWLTETDQIWSQIFFLPCYRITVQNQRSCFEVRNPLYFFCKHIQLIFSKSGWLILKDFDNQRLTHLGVLEEMLEHMICHFLAVNITHHES